MPNSLIFPDGIRLARQDEIPGPEPRRAAAWARIQSANILPGFVLRTVSDQRFMHYAEINADAPRIWIIFRDLCLMLVRPTATLIAGEAEGQLVSIASAEALAIIDTLEPHRYQLAHDGFLHYGLANDHDGKINEVLVTPEKHFRVWLNDEDGFRSVMRRHHLQEVDNLEFLDEYPRVTIALPQDTITFHSLDDLIKSAETELLGKAKA